MTHVLVQSLRAGEGISFEEGLLVAHAGGVPVAQAAADSPVFEDAGLVALFPQLSFSHSAPATRDYLIDLDLRATSGRRAEGVIVCEGRRYPWSAERVADPIFAARPAEPAAAGMPAQAARGWAYRLPGQLTGDDPVLERRLGLAVVSILADLSSGREDRLPRQVRISNVFSAQVPPPAFADAPALDSLAAARRR